MTKIAPLATIVNMVTLIALQCWMSPRKTKGRSCAERVTARPRVLMLAARDPQGTDRRRVGDTLEVEREGREKEGGEARE